MRERRLLRRYVRFLSLSKALSSFIFSYRLHSFVIELYICLFYADFFPVILFVNFSLVAYGTLSEPHRPTSQYQSLVNISSHRTAFLNKHDESGPNGP